MATTHVDAAPAIVQAPPAASVAERAVLALAFASAASIVFSIAVSQILMGAGLAVLLGTRKKIEFPPILPPLVGFAALTVLALLTSDDPASGLPQVRKFYVFGIIPLIYSGFHGAAHVSALILAWSGAAAVSACVGLFQSYERWRDAIVFQAPLYEYVLDGRITGLQSHWMTFGGVQMIVLMMLLAWLMFGEPGRWKWAGWACAALIWLALVLGLTRSIFLAGVPAGVAVLVWASRRWLLLMVPAGVLVLLLAATPVRERVLSVLSPHGEVDSNSRRSLMLRTGLNMIRAHPVLGVGPEQVERQFASFLPADAPQPLPKGWYGHLHNVYVQYAAERGIPALLCILWLFTRIVRDHLRETGLDRYVVLATLAATAAVLAEGFFEHNLGDSEVLTMFCACVACGYVALRALRAGAS